MTPFVSFINQILAVLTVLANAAALVLLVSLIWRKGPAERIIKFFGDNFLLFAFIISLVATSGSLFFSEIAKFEPCKLCWFQRIFMYPQTILWGIALAKKDFGAAIYGVIFSAIGGLIAAYHYLLQIGAVAPTSCSAVGYAVSCSKNFGTTFGYITIPFMAFSAFLLIILIIISARPAWRKNKF